MDYREYKPPADLSHLIECFWTNTLYDHDFNHRFDLIIPDGSAEIIFMLKGSYRRQNQWKSTANIVDDCSLVTPFQRAVKVYQKPYTSCLAIRLKSGALQQLSAISLEDLQREVYPLETIMPELADFTMDLVLKKLAPKQLIEKITGFLRRVVSNRKRPFLVDRYIAATIKTKGSITIQQFCTSIRTHKSTLEKNFKIETGMTPKQYARLIRFNYLLHRLLFSNSNLAEISCALGYYDQSHMTREFSKIVGMPPSLFLEKKFAVAKLAALGIANKITHY